MVRIVKGLEVRRGGPTPDQVFDWARQDSLTLLARQQFYLSRYTQLVSTCTRMYGILVSMLLRLGTVGYTYSDFNDVGDKTYYTFIINSVINICNPSNI